MNIDSNLRIVSAQLEEVRKATVSRMFCDSGEGVKDIQPLGFTLIFPDLLVVLLLYFRMSELKTNRKHY